MNLEVVIIVNFLLQPHARKIDETRTRMTDEERSERNAQLQRTMALLVHASACANPECPSTNCSKVKSLFHHAVSCHLKVAGGCQFCRCLLALSYPFRTCRLCPVNPQLWHVTLPFWAGRTSINLSWISTPHSLMGHHTPFL